MHRADGGSHHPGRRDRPGTGGLPALCCLSERVHSRYQRTVADLPWQGVAVCLRLTTRHFFCDNGDCRRVVFTELLPQVVTRYARRTDRLADALRLIG